MSGDRFTDLIAGGEKGALELRAYRFEVVEGPDRGKSVKSERGSIVIGSSPDADLVLTDGAVSRAHAKLVPFGDGVEITDLESKNGTFVAGARLMHARVAPGTEFTVGRTVIRIIPEDDAPGLEPSELTQFGPLRGRSRAARQLFAMLEVASKTESPVLIEGERGTGKLRSARSVHEKSSRAASVLTVLDARTIEGTQFVHEITASKGTVVIREIDRLPGPAQLALLRVIETVDAASRSRLDQPGLSARMMATTSKDLRAMAAAGAFDRELLLKLSIVHVKVPPLRERASDLPILIEDILSELGHPKFDMGPADLGRMQAYAWPDNIAELKSVIQRAVSFEGASMSAEPREETPKPAKDAVVGADLPYKQARAQMIEAFEREYVRGLLDRHEGNVSKAARAAGIDRVYLHRLLRKYGL
jgi:DNA-binding NtrC family response regulator